MSHSLNYLFFEYFFWLETVAGSGSPESGPELKIITPMKIRILFFLAFAFMAFNAHTQETLTSKGGYTLDANEEHYYIFVLNNRPADLPELRASITKYIWKHYPKANLKITQIEIDGELSDVPLLHVQSFPNKAEALAFHKALKTDHPDFLHMGMTVDYFPVSKTNFEAIVRSKSLNGYKDFFLKNY